MKLKALLTSVLSEMESAEHTGTPRIDEPPPTRASTDAEALEEMRRRVADMAEHSDLMRMQLQQLSAS
eukprot:CAMPEP_0172192362 /NCGR_PEP_ID=MMETSP1050-20130122/24282_1 /TAXON_ID=233186 /ORGANISM="Cryptomonas curvata, Strain CCAP979/52" /LENGTH=67 /DNA_ID=CAMNT_0012867649 /DNA_START=399 /DNA_END=598 /DNA_ORIENTATION=-